MTDFENSWAGLLDADGDIRWQGRPEPGVQFEWGSPLEMFISVFFVGFSIFWMVGASAAGGYFWMFGLLFFGIGLYQFVGVHFWRAYERSHTHYTLTSKRAIIGTRIFGRRKLESYPIEAHTHLSLEEDLPLSHVYFATKSITRNRQTTEKQIGFERIKNGRDVLQKMRQIQDTKS